jgi:hypothetical protein
MSTVRHLPPETLEDQLARLDRPWIADEGALDAGFERGPLDRPPRERGLAFDASTTVRWDESGVQVISGNHSDPGVVTLASDVLLRERFEVAGLRKLRRFDFLAGGVLLGSRYTALEASHA